MKYLMTGIEKERKLTGTVMRNLSPITIFGMTSSTPYS